MSQNETYKKETGKEDPHLNTVGSGLVVPSSSNVFKEEYRLLEV